MSSPFSQQRDEHGACTACSDVHYQRDEHGACTACSDVHYL